MRRHIYAATAQECVFRISRIVLPRVEPYLGSLNNGGLFITQLENEEVLYAHLFPLSAEANGPTFDLH